MLNRWPDDGLLDPLAEEGMGCIAFSPLAQGLLTDRYLQCHLEANGTVDGVPADSRMARQHFLRPDMLTPQLLQQLQQWNAEAQAEGRTLAEYALRWILQQQGVTSVLVGASSVAQLERNLKAVAP
jgi:L-glyceraldehyde 3-phosphate reductase